MNFLWRRGGVDAFCVNGKESKVCEGVPLIVEVVGPTHVSLEERVNLGDRRIEEGCWFKILKRIPSLGSALYFREKLV